MFTCGFYNSINHDRAYDSTTFSQLFRGIINDGVFMNIGDKLMVKANGGMQVAVGTGRAWFDDTWSNNDAPYLLDLVQSDLWYRRIDAVILEVNHEEEVRNNFLKVITGTPAAEPQKPELIRSDTVNQYPLCYISIGRDIREVESSAIENMVGLDDCPFITGILETVKTDELIAQWNAEWKEYISKFETESSEWSEEKKEEFNDFIFSIENEVQAFLSSYESDFQTWFGNIQATLSDDVAGNLANLINEESEREFRHFYSIMNRVTTITRNSFGKTESIVEISDEATATTTFIEEPDGKKIQTSIIPVEGNWNYIQTSKFTKQDGNTVITESYTKSGKM